MKFILILIMVNIQIVIGCEVFMFIEQDQNQLNSLWLQKVVEIFCKMSCFFDFGFQDIFDVQVCIWEGYFVELIFIFSVDKVFLLVVYSKECLIMVKVVIGSNFSNQVIYMEEVIWWLMKLSLFIIYLMDFFVGEFDEMVSDVKFFYVVVVEIMISIYEFLGKVIFSDVVIMFVFNMMVQIIKQQYKDIIVFKLFYVVLIM